MDHVLIALLLACSEGPTVAGAPPRTVALCAPFVDWPLPPSDGTVVHCDPRRLEVHFAQGQADALASGWRTAVRAAGWAEDVDSSAPGLVNVRYVQGEAVLALTLVDGASHTSLVVTLDPPVR